MSGLNVRKRERERERRRESLLGTTLISSSSNDTSYGRDLEVLLTIKKCLKVSNYIALSTERERREREKRARE